ncbi:MAG: phosphoribosylformylglycinamidine synthase subunit PurQ [Bacteroidota bacterium]
MKFGVVVFPGSNCDRDMIHVLKNIMHQQVEEVWHKETQLNQFTTDDCIILPGGFSYGDYLRTGAIARFSPIMEAIIEFAHKGGKVWGICNGFQILCESGLLPGALLRNNNMKYTCKNIFLKVNTTNTTLTQACTAGEILKVPIAHGEGRYYADAATIEKLQKQDQILFNYCDEQGVETADSNPNGSLLNIAGICNEQRNVFGMMPHPERASESILGNSDGYKLFESLVMKELAH